MVLARPLSAGGADFRRLSFEDPFAGVATDLLAGVISFS
jgi:hypothetical protein